MAKNQESVTREVYGPKTFIEVGNTTSNSSGGTAFTQQAINDSGERFVTSHNENGLTNIESEGTLQMVVGNKTDSETCSLLMDVVKGHFDIVSEDGNIGLKANKTLTLEANTIVLQAASIEIGEKDKTESISMSARTMNITDVKYGNIAKVLKTDIQLQCLAGTYLEDFTKGLL